MRVHAIIGGHRLLVAREIDGREKQSNHRHAIGDGDALKELKGGGNLAKRRWQLGDLLAEDCGAVREDGRRRLEAVGRVEGRIGERREYLVLVEAKIGDERVDVGIIHPEAARAGLKRLARWREVGSLAGRIGQRIQQRDFAAILDERLGSAPAAPSRADDGNVGGSVACMRGDGARMTSAVVASAAKVTAMVESRKRISRNGMFQEHSRVVIACDSFSSFCLATPSSVSPRPWH